VTRALVFVLDVTSQATAREKKRAYEASDEYKAKMARAKQLALQKRRSMHALRTENAIKAKQKREEERMKEAKDKVSLSSPIWFCAHKIFATL
jgi:hypothetical protein